MTCPPALPDHPSRPIFALFAFSFHFCQFGVDRQFNPTKMFIDFFAMLGLVTKRKRATGAWMRLREERIKEVQKEESKKAA